VSLDHPTLPALFVTQDVWILFRGLRKPLSQQGQIGGAVLYRIRELP
jgi:hypothetical protein